MKKKNSRIGFFLVLPGLAGLCAFFVIPFLRSLYYTFTQGVSEPRFAGLSNFQDLLANPVFRQAVGNTALFLILGAPLVLACALLVSVVLTKGRFSWQRWALLLPFVLPASSLAVAWEKIWGRALLDGSGALPIAMLLYLLRNVGYLSVILTSAIRALPVEYRESYCLDGGGEGGYVLHVLLPLLSPTMLFAGIVAVMNYFLLFRDVYMLYGDSPPGRLYMLQHFMNSSFYRLDCRIEEKFSRYMPRRSKLHIPRFCRKRQNSSISLLLLSESNPAAQGLIRYLWFCVGGRKLCEAVLIGSCVPSSSQRGFSTVWQVRDLFL